MNTFPRGIHLPGFKHLAEKSIILSMPAPQRVYIAMQQNIGAAAKPIVAVGDAVKIGQKIGESMGVVSANVFSSVSGIVTSIEVRNAANGKCQHIVIENDGTSESVSLPAITNPSALQILDRIDECGIVGMGGAGFPTKIKLSPKESIQHFIINAAECEPYITCDYRIMLDYTEQFLRGCLLLAKTVGLTTATIGIEENKPDAIARLNYIIGYLKLDITIMPLKVKYPQGAEKQLIFAVTAKKVPTGKLPSVVGCIVSNVHTAFSTYLAVTQGTPLYRRVVTVSGGGIAEAKNIWVSNGALYSDVIAFCGGESQNPTVKLINGGPMMGIAVAGAQFSCTKTTSSLLLLTKDEAFCGRPSACINCCKCAKACPMSLMPMFIDAYGLVGDVDNAVKYGANNCIECGCCAYVCPAKRPLTQSIKLAKQKYRERGLSK